MKVNIEMTDSEPRAKIIKGWQVARPRLQAAATSWHKVPCPLASRDAKLGCLGTWGENDLEVARGQEVRVLVYLWVFYWEDFVGEKQALFEKALGKIFPEQIQLPVKADTLCYIWHIHSYSSNNRFFVSTSGQVTYFPRERDLVWGLGRHPRHLRS